MSLFIIRNCAARFANDHAEGDLLQREINRCHLERDKGTELQSHDSNFWQAC